MHDVVQVDVLISEATIRSLFGLYGEVIDVALKKSQFDKVKHPLLSHFNPFLSYLDNRI